MLVLAYHWLEAGEPKADLRSSRRWQETTARIADLFSTPPPLVLTEGQS